MESPEPGAAVNDALNLRHYLLSIKGSKITQGCDDLTKALRYVVISKQQNDNEKGLVE